MNIVLTTIILFVVFGVLLFMGVPISVSIIVSSIVTAMSTLSWDQITFITMQKMNSGIESFSLLAVPLFILAGNIMNNGGIAKRLVNFAQLFVGKLPGNHGTGQYSWKYALWSALRFFCSGCICNGWMYQSD